MIFCYVNLCGVLFCNSDFLGWRHLWVALGHEDNFTWNLDHRCIRPIVAEPSSDPECQKSEKGTEMLTIQMAGIPGSQKISMPGFWMIGMPGFWMITSSKDADFSDFHPQQNSAVVTSRCVQHTCALLSLSIWDFGCTCSITPSCKAR